MMIGGRYAEAGLSVRRAAAEAVEIANSHEIEVKFEINGIVGTALPGDTDDDALKRWNQERLRLIAEGQARAAELDVTAGDCVLTTSSSDPSGVVTPASFQALRLEVEVLRGLVDPLRRWLKLWANEGDEDADMTTATEWPAVEEALVNAIDQVDTFNAVRGALTIAGRVPRYWYLSFIAKDQRILYDCFQGACIIRVDGDDVEACKQVALGRARVFGFNPENCSLIAEVLAWVPDEWVHVKLDRDGVRRLLEAGLGLGDPVLTR